MLAATQQRATRRPGLVTPKNGHYIVALIAGGPPDRARELRDILSQKRGILVKYHWDWEKQRLFQRPIPTDTDLVIGLKSMMAHNLYYMLKDSVKKAGAHFVMTSHKWSTMDAALRQSICYKKAPPLPVEVTSVAYLRDHDDHPERQENAEATPATAPEQKLASVTQIKPDIILTPQPPQILNEQDLRDLRAAQLQRESMTLILELQAKMHALNIDNILVERTQYTVTTPQPAL